MTGDAIVAERNLVVASLPVAVALTSIVGVAATTFGDVLGQPDDSVEGYFHEETAQVIATPGQTVDDVVEKLVDLGVPTMVVVELTDERP